MMMMTSPGALKPQICALTRTHNTLEKLTQRWNSYRHRKSLSHSWAIQTTDNRSFSFEIRFNYMRVFGYFRQSVGLYLKTDFKQPWMFIWRPVYIDQMTMTCCCDQNLSKQQKKSPAQTIEMINKWLAEKWNARTNEMNNNHTMENGQHVWSICFAARTCKWDLMKRVHSRMEWKRRRSRKNNK